MILDDLGFCNVKLDEVTQLVEDVVRMQRTVYARGLNVIGPCLVREAVVAGCHGACRVLRYWLGYIPDWQRWWRDIDVVEVDEERQMLECAQERGSDELVCESEER